MSIDYPRPCERQCKKCGIWKHYSRFRKSTVSKKIYFSPCCRDCEQKERNEKKNADRPKSIIEQRARAAASKAGISFEFVWTQMNYRSLVPEMRAAMSDEGSCPSCGHKFLNERDIQIEHGDPPRFEKDWARIHRRNLRLVCGSCNRTKGSKPHAEWLDEQEGARLSNLNGLSSEPKIDNTQPEHQLSLFVVE
jgi:hypothetical protein